MRIEVVRGDLTRFAADAVVNAANEGLAGGGGLDGALHRAAGPSLMDACRALPPVARAVRCPTGEARLTPGFDLPTRFVIHAVGPVYGRHRDAPALLAAAYRASLHLCEVHGLRTVGLPALSCGVYGYPAREAAPIAVGVCRERAWDLDLATFVLFNDALVEIWRDAVASPA